MTATSPSRRRWRPFRRLILILLISYGALVLFACTGADRLIFFPPRPGYSDGGKNLVRFDTSAGESIAAFHFPAAAGQPTLIYSHGNAEDIAGSLPVYQAWHAHGWGVLAYDYPGYGLSSGRPTERSVERAIEAAWNFLTNEQAVPANHIIIVGRSVGSGPSVWLAGKHESAGLVLISPFTSVFAVRPPAQYLLPGNRFPNLSRIRRIDTPLCVIHGEADRIIPAKHGRALVAASPAASKTFLGIPDAGHNDLFYLAEQKIHDQIARFAAEVVTP